LGVVIWGKKRRTGRQENGGVIAKTGLQKDELRGEGKRVGGGRRENQCEKGLGEDPEQGNAYFSQRGGESESQ